MKKRIIAIIFISLVAIYGTFLSLYTTGGIKPTASSQNHGYATIKVLESNTLAPILNATVCIVETRGYYQTDKFGYTETITIPIISNTNFDISLKRNWGEFTIIVYKPGYSTYVSYYNPVFANTTNVGIICCLPPIINPGDPLVISNANKPSDDYSITLANLYKK